MESFVPLYSRIDDEQNSLQETRLKMQELGQSRTMPHARATCGPSFQPGSTTSSLAASDDHPSPSQPYSPTNRELELHPIRQRLSIQGDEIVTGLEFAPEATFEFHRWTRPEEEELAQEAEHKVPEAMADTTIKEGDAVSYAWGGDKKGGTVTEVATEGSVTMDTARGNTATKEAGHNDPALRLERAGHDVVKNASEVQKEKAGETHNEGGVQKTVTEDKNGEPKAGEKRAAEHVEEPKANGEEPKKKKGRPAKNGATGPKKDVKKRPPKKAATESGEPRRSGRVAAKS